MYWAALEPTSLIGAIINALPPTVATLDIESQADKHGHTSDICVAIALILPRLQNLRLSLSCFCSTIFGSSPDSCFPRLRMATLAFYSRDGSICNPDVYYRRDSTSRKLSKVIYCCAQDSAAPQDSTPNPASSIPTDTAILDTCENVLSTFKSTVNTNAFPNIQHAHLIDHRPSYLPHPRYWNRNQAFATLLPPQGEILSCTAFSRPSGLGPSGNWKQTDLYVTGPSHIAGGGGLDEDTFDFYLGEERGWSDSLREVAEVIEGEGA
jgi:hypothetical protein